MATSSFAAMELSSPLAPDVILGRLRDRAKDWRESHLPAQARLAGFYGVSITIHDRSFRVQFQGGPRNPYYPRFDGRVAVAGGGSTVSGTFRGTFGTYVSTTLFVIWSAGISWFTRSAFFSFVVLVMFGAMYRIGYVRALTWRAGLAEIVAAAADVDLAGRPADSI